MRYLTTFALVLAVTAFAGSAAVFAAPAAGYKEKKALCERRAKDIGFGIHFIKKRNWVKDCVAGKYPI
jgi:hypothetical protein